MTGEQVQKVIEQIMNTPVELAQKVEALSSSRGGASAVSIPRYATDRQRGIHLTPV